MASVEDR
jgi:hypothetical protein